MTAGLAALNDDKIGGGAVALVPQAADGARRAAARYDGCNSGFAALHQCRQLGGQSGTRDDGICACCGGGAHGIGVLRGRDHRIDCDHTLAACDRFGFLDMLFQGAQIGTVRVAGKLGAVIARVRGRDHAHAAAGGHMTGKITERHADAHAALNEWNGEGVRANGDHSAPPSAAITASAPAVRSARISRRGRISLH